MMGFAGRIFGPHAHVSGRRRVNVIASLLGERMSIESVERLRGHVKTSEHEMK